MTPDDPERRVVLGQIGGAFGVRGWSRVQSFTDPPEALLGYEPLLLQSGEDWEPCEVEAARLTDRGIVLKLAGVDSRDGAALLNGRQIAVPRSALPVPAPGQFYLSDLEGLEVRSPEGHLLGRVHHFLDTPAHPVMVVRGEREYLVPVVAERILEVSVPGGTVTVDWQPDW